MGWDYERVTATADETAEYRAKHHGHRPSVYRVRCTRCGRRYWGSGVGIGSHRRACEAPLETVAEFLARQEG